MLLPHTNSRGGIDTATYVSHCYTYTMVLIKDPDTTAVVNQPPSSQKCLQAPYPARYRLISHESTAQDVSGPVAWMGSLITDSRDLSGLMYRRNRYYDPQSGQFTQADPIGLAGGVNVYGFAEGDPVTYTDPFGLKPCRDRVIAIRRRVYKIRVRIDEYLNAVPRGENDAKHMNSIQQEIGGFNDELDAYHSSDNSEKCSDDDDDFRGARNAGLALIRMQLPAPVRADNPHPHPPGYRGRPGGLMTVGTDATTVATARNVEKAGWVGLAGTLVIAAGALLLAPIGL